MRGRASNDLLPISATLLLALALAIMPLPEVIQPLRPDWVALVVIYWCLMAPGRLGLLSAFFLGLILDTLSGALLGQHALALLCVAYLGLRFHLRIRVFPIWQMSITVMGMLALYQFLLFWVDGVAGRTVTGIERWAPVFVGGLLWPLILGFLENIREDVSARV